ncbi:magnesium transporter [Nonlabens dokdonensis]|uniref:Magnesium transporter MgtE n=2 Tax=Nonlabens dokdonensis TaxID=328515 RepID=L7W5K3_NONDD|nr:magnesium transporter [Nonlabens dokdonensis]AGC76935.1 MgtE family, magnesium ion transporter [Nonlabens dokdonensis DSW-6]PZX36841.1 magnesium transporter [Nonlabens dokdonensis]
MQFNITEDFLEEIRSLIEANDSETLERILEEVHFADIAEIIDELNLEQAVFIVKLLDSEKTSEALMELDEAQRDRVLNALSPREIAEELEEMDTDDAADILNDLPENIAQEVINEIEDEQHAEDIVDLLRYEENSAGGLMAKELVRVNENWTVTGCVSEMRAQAENVTRVHSIYVVDNNNKLKGRLSLKDLLTSKETTPIKDVYIPKVDFVTVNTSGEEVARIMRKYDLEAIPVIDELERLVGRITIDDIVDFITEEAEKDYQLASGISQDVEANDSIWDLTKARLPWLVLGLLGGIGAAAIMGGFEEIFEKHAVLFFFTPLIAAMAGNVGVQSSAIIVQGIANDDLKGSIGNRLVKEILLAMLNGVILAILLFAYTFATKGELLTSLAISTSLFAVIIVAGLVGTFVPLALHKRGIDPALATGPFITTSNDIFGILIYFMIAKAIIGI